MWGGGGGCQLKIVVPPTKTRAPPPPPSAPLLENPSYATGGIHLPHGWLRARVQKRRRKHSVRGRGGGGLEVCSPPQIFQVTIFEIPGKFGQEHPIFRQQLFFLLVSCINRIYLPVYMNSFRATQDHWSLFKKKICRRIIEVSAQDTMSPPPPPGPWEWFLN